MMNIHTMQISLTLLRVKRFYTTVFHIFFYMKETTYDKTSF